MNTLEAITRKIRQSTQLYLTWAAIALLGVGMQSCIYDDDSATGNPSGSERTLTLQFSVPSASQSNTTTRATADEVAERRVDNISVWGLAAIPGTGPDNKCVYYHYIASPQSEAQSQTADGAFNIVLPNWNTNATQILVYANYGKELAPGDELGKSVYAVIYDTDMLTAAASADKPVAMPLPMSSLKALTSTTKTLTVDLRRSVARLDVRLKNDIADAGLNGRMLFDQAQIYFSKLLSRSAICNAHEEAVLSMSIGTPSFYNTAWLSMDKFPQYTYQRTFNGKDAGGTSDWGPVGITLRIPYTEDGVTVNDNYYRTEIINPEFISQSDADKRYWLLPNRLYRITLHIVGLGIDGLGRTEIEVLPWNTEDVDASQGYSLAPTIDLTAVAPNTPVFLCKGNHLKVEGNYSVADLHFKLSNPANVSIEAATNADGKPDWKLTQTAYVAASAPASDKKVTLTMRSKNGVVLQTCTVTLATH